jgi:hypothetical protein
MITLQSAEPILEPTLFRLLPEAEKNTASLVSSCILNCALIAFLLIVGTVAHHEIQLKKMETTEIYFPVTPPPRIKIKLPAPKRPAPMEPKIAKLEAPKIKIPRVEPKPEIKIPVIKEQIVLQRMAAPSVVLAPQPKVVLAAAPALTPQVKPSITPVHFGDLNGVMPNPNANRPATIAALGNPYGGAQGGAGTPHGVVGSAAWATVPRWAPTMERAEVAAVVAVEAKWLRRAFPVLLQQDRRACRVCLVMNLSRRRHLCLSAVSNRNTQPRLVSSKSKAM